MLTIKRLCPKCGEEYPLNIEYFNKNKSMKNGFDCYCRVCRIKYSRNYYKENPEKYREYSRERSVEFQEKAKNSVYKRKYGLSSKIIEEMKIKQDNKCAICGNFFRKTPYVDHDHQTGEIRGLLCGRCNRGLGHFYDDFELLINAVEYLVRYKIKKIT